MIKSLMAMSAGIALLGASAVVLSEPASAGAAPPGCNLPVSENAFDRPRSA